jgi:colanic acid biosynthesis glycosyl transferase WcaI
MRILLITDSFPPEVRSASFLMETLARTFQRRGHDVVVMTGQPAYNLAVAGRRSSEVVELEERDGLRVISIRSPQHHNVGYLRRGLAQFLLPLLFVRRGWRYLDHHVDGVIIYSPPLPLGLLGYGFSRRTKVVVNVQDLFPQHAIDLGVLRNPVLIWIYRRIEALVYRRATRIATHSPSNTAWLENNSARSGQFMTVWNWVDLSWFDSIPATSELRNHLGLKGKFVFVFAGTFGPSQALELLLEGARVLSSDDRVRFLFIGGGPREAALRKTADQLGLKNVVFHPFIERRALVSALKDLDVGIVSLSRDNKTPAVPGKLADYMASGMAVAAFLQEASDAHGLISDARCGVSVTPTGPADVAGVFSSFQADSDRARKMGRRGRDYAGARIDVAIAADAFEEAFTTQSDEPAVVGGTG